MNTPQLLVTTSQSADAPHYTLLVAQQQAEIRAAQRLRHRVFAGEMGAALHSSQPGLDVDEFDAHCDHLVVREDRTGEIVGTYRMLSPDGARCAGGLYCETEFAIPGLAGLREALVETGRSCVHPGHRTGAVVNLVWPVIGPLTRRTGTIFVDRERLSTLPQTVAAVSGSLAGGVAIGAFPEGTTWCGLASGRFRPALFQAAVDTATPVRPVALRYRLAGAGATTVASFVGSATVWDAVVLLAGVRGLVVEMQLLPLLPADGSDRRVLAAGAQAAVTAATLPLLAPATQPVPVAGAPPPLPPRAA